MKTLPFKSKTQTLLAVLALFVITSCSTDPLPSPALNVTERIDMIAEGDLQLEEFRQNDELDASDDLITFNYFGNPAENIDFVLHLSNGYRLVLTVYDAERMNPWEQVGQPYNIYPVADEEDKLSFVRAELLTSANEPLFTSNQGPGVPPGIALDVFKIMKFDGNLIQARMRDMTLYNAGNAEKSIRINGTFVGAITFE
jgi:hypothetical protein